MKRIGIVVLSALVITAVSIYGVVFADNANTVTKKNGLQIVANQDNKSNIVNTVKPGDKAANASCYSSTDANNNLAKIMSDNGFGDAAKYMQTGDYEKMNEFMNNLNEEDYQKMIDIMKANGYGSMAQMMESIGREGMIQMHNSNNSMHSGSTGMMGGFGTDF